MDALSLMVLWTDEYRQSAEFLALQRWTRLQARRVWSDVVEVEAPEEIDRNRPLLVLGERCLLGERSMTAMRRAIDQGAGAATPTRLSRTGWPGLNQIRTLAAMEQCEARALTPDELSCGPESPPYAALLVAPDVLAGLSDITKIEWLGGHVAAARTVTTGLCHEFKDYYGETRHDILPFLNRSRREVLEIGCGRGLTGALVKERFGSRVTGIELNPVVAREAAKRLDRVIVGDVLEVEAIGTYDAVVACELFEHLTRQELLLERLRSWLRPGGVAVFSIPNVGHYSIVQDLLAGRWDYLPIGLLCHTHYRFFTRHTLEQLFAAAGFTEIDVIAQETEAPAWLASISNGLEIDSESLRTKRFYVVVHV